MYIQILSNFCIDRSGKGVYPYQKFLTELILEDKSKFFLKFGTAKVEGALRPYVYFTRPKNCSRENFLVDNPMLQ
jgi:chemotaxis methyl-accepting protein methylase